MKIIYRIGDNKSYYSTYNLNTFFNIDALNEQISRNIANIHLLNAAIFYCTNYERYKLNIPVCKFHEKLLEMSMLHSTQMNRYNFFSHENPYNSRYRTLQNRLESVYDNAFKGFWSYGENIADYPLIKADERFVIKRIMDVERYFSVGGRKILPCSYYEFAKTVVNGWMHSEGHRRNILNPEFMYLGCGCVAYERKETNHTMRYFKVTQNFGGELIYQKANKIIKVIKIIK
jgi:uncharacterized protein YkwD